MRNFCFSTKLPDVAALHKANFISKLRLLKDAGLLRSDVLASNVGGASQWCY